MRIANQTSVSNRDGKVLESLTNIVSLKKFWQKKYGFGSHSHVVMDFLFSNVGCTTVTCSFTVDNEVEYAKYNGAALTITTDDLTSWKKLKSVQFQSCSEENPGTLQVKGTDYAANGSKFWHV